MAWTEKARAASLEARRRGMQGKLAEKVERTLTAQEMIHQAFSHAHADIARNYSTRVEDLFERMKAQHGENLKGVSNSWTWARTYNHTVAPNLKSEHAELGAGPFSTGSTRSTRPSSPPTPRSMPMRRLVKW